MKKSNTEMGKIYETFFFDAGFQYETAFSRYSDWLEEMQAKYRTFHIDFVSFENTREEWQTISGQWSIEKEEALEIKLCEKNMTKGSTFDDLIKMGYALLEDYPVKKNGRIIKLLNSKDCTSIKFVINLNEPIGERLACSISYNGEESIYVNPPVIYAISNVLKKLEEDLIGSV